MAPAIEIKEAHFPDRAPIEKYGEGGFVFNNFVHHGIITCLPSGIYALPDEGQGLSAQMLEPILKEAEAIDLLICLLYTSPSPRD